MTNRNPYENGVDIPDFVEKKDDDIDMSVFKMAEGSTFSESYDIEDDEDDYDDEPKRKLSSKGIIIIGGVLVVVLFIAAISGWIFGISKNNALTKLNADYTTLKAKLDETNTTISALENQVVVLTAEVEKYKSEESSGNTSGEPTSANTKYKMEEGINVRKSPGSNEFANFNKLPDEVADELYYDATNGVTTRAGAILPVYETKEVSGNTWGRIADNAWVCLNYNGEKWGTKQ